MFGRVGIIKHTGDTDEILKIKIEIPKGVIEV